MKTKILLFAICFLSASLTYTQNPYQSIGKSMPKGKMLTLSNGKYQEFFPSDTIVPIGSVMFNTVTGEVVGFIKKDKIYAEYNLEPELMSRWLSPDPLAAKNSESSPYSAMNNNPIIFIDPDGKDAVIAIRPGVNGGNPTVTVTVTFYASEGGLTNSVTENAVSSFQGTWGNGSATSVGNGTYAGASFKNVEIDGQKYNVSYNLVLKEAINPSSTVKEGQNVLSVISDSKTSSTSHYGSGQLDYRAGQEKSSKNTTFGHEVGHAMGIGHNDKMKNEKGVASISSYQSGRQVITKDVVNSVQGAIQMSKGAKSIVTLVTGRGLSDMNTLNMKDSHKQTVKSTQYPTIDNKQ